MNLNTLPKAELHCHFDGSLPLQTLQTLLRRPDLSAHDVQAPPRCANLADYLTKFDLPLSGLQTAEQLAFAAGALLEAMAAETITYTEIRFAPQLHRALPAQQALSCEAVVESVLNGIKAAQARGCQTKAQLILCAMRHHSPEQNEEVLHAALTFYGAGVCALDLAGDEAAYPMHAFSPLFRAARAEKLPFTIHAGECGSVSNVREAIELGARRLGHGIALAQDPALMREAARLGVGLEMCPTSNLQTGAASDWASYPLPLFVRAGIPVAVCTDNRTVSATTLTHELEKVYQAWPDDELLHTLTQNAFHMAFAL